MDLIKLSYLIFNENIGEPSLKEIGKMWYDHHDRAWDFQLEKRFGKKYGEMYDRAWKTYRFLKKRAIAAGKEPPERIDIGEKYGKKLGIEHNPGNPGNAPGSVFRAPDVFATLHQRAGERSSAAATRLMRYADGERKKLVRDSNGKPVRDPETGKQKFYYDNSGKSLTDSEFLEKHNKNMERVNNARERLSQKRRS